MKNTLSKGKYRVITYQLENVWYASALEFNITVDGDSPEQVSHFLREAVVEFLNEARSQNWEHLVNQEVDPELDTLWSNLQKGNIPSPYKIDSFSNHLINA